MATILVVDDDDGVRGAIRKALEAVNHEVIEAADGAEGLARFAERAPDLVITDVFMPGINGLEAAIRVISEFAGARVLVMSGGGWRTSSSVLDQARALGAAAVLAKPFELDDLYRAVDGALPRAG